MNRTLAALLLLLFVMLSGVAGNASARAVVQPENRVGLSRPDTNIDAYENGLPSLEAPWEDTILVYDPATGVLFYVRQNPWTAFDPLGLAIGQSQGRDSIGTVRYSAEERAAMSAAFKADGGWKGLGVGAWSGIAKFTTKVLAYGGALIQGKIQGPDPAFYDALDRYFDSVARDFGVDSSGTNYKLSSGVVELGADAALAGRTMKGGTPGKHLDIGGEGRYPKAVNINPSTTGTGGKPIPNLAHGTAEDVLPTMPTDSARRITIENAPISDATASQTSRVLRPGGKIEMEHPSDVAEKLHEKVIKKVDGKVKQKNSTLTPLVEGGGSVEVTRTVIRKSKK